MWRLALRRDPTPKGEASGHIPASFFRPLKASTDDAGNLGREVSLMPIRLCNVKGCPNPVHYRGRCAEHSRERARIHARGSAQNIYQSKRWKITKRHVLAEQPQCADCPRLAVDVHHIVPLDDGGAPFARQNLQGLCKSCHSKRHRQMASVQPKA